MSNPAYPPTQYGGGGAPPAYPGGQGGPPPGAGYPPPGQGYGQPPPGYGQPQPVQQIQPVSSTTVVVAGRGGGCPQCGNGSIVEDYSICGIILAVVCFPWGLICCLLMKERRCTNCHAKF